MILSSQAEVVSVAHLTLLRDREEAASCVSPALPAPNTSGRLWLKHLVNTEHAQGVRLFTTLAMGWLELHPFWDPELNGRPGNCLCKGARGVGSIFRGRQSLRASSSLFLASHFCCMEARAVPKMQSGTIGMSKMSSFSLSDRFVRLSYLARFCNTIFPIDFPVAWTMQYRMWRQMSVITAFSPRTFGLGLVFMASHGSAW